MAEHTNFSALVIAGGCVVGGILIGLLLRALFGAMSHRAESTRTSWDDLGWALLKDLALPTGVFVGVWWAAQILSLRPPWAHLVDRVLLAAVVLSVALALAGAAAAVVRSVTLARSGVAQSATIFVNIARAVVVAVGILVLLQSVGVSITPLLTAFGVGGLAVALALQDTLSNLFAGVQVLASKKVQPGDFIRLNTGEDGYVVDINWRNTTVRQLGGNIVIVPNARLAEAVLTNFHQPLQDMSVLVQVGVAYASDLDHVERVTVEVGRDVMTSVDGGVRDHQPFIRYHTFGESSIDFSVILRTGEYSGQYLVVHEFIKRLHARYRSEGIEIPFPMRTVVLPDSRQESPGNVVPRARGKAGADPEPAPRD